MATSMKCMTFSGGNLQKLLNRKAVSAISIKRHYANESSKKETPVVEQYDEEYEREVARLRNVSRLSNWQKIRMDATQPPDIDEASKYTRDTRKMYRKVFANIGISSGLNPGVMWPSKQEMQSMIEDEREWEPSWEELVKRVSDKKEAQLHKDALRDKKIEKGMEKMDQLIKQYHEKQKKLETVTQKSSERDDQLLIEFREMFGYNANPKHHKFRDFKSKRLLESKMEKKKALKQSKKEKMEESIQKLVEKKEAAE